MTRHYKYIPLVPKHFKLSRTVSTLERCVYILEFISGTNQMLMRIWGNKKGERERERERESFAEKENIIVLSSFKNPSDFPSGTY